MLENIPDWIKVILGLVGGGGLTKIYINRMQAKDRQGLTKAGEHKTDAESTKLKAEAKKLQEDAHAVAVDYALRIAQRLTEENEDARNELNKAETMLDHTRTELYKTQDELRKIMDMCNVCSVNLERLQKELDTEKKKNQEYALEIEKLTKQLKGE